MICCCSCIIKEKNVLLKSSRKVECLRLKVPVMTESQETTAPSRDCTSLQVSGVDNAGRTWQLQQGS